MSRRDKKKVVSLVSTFLSCIGGVNTNAATTLPAQENRNFVRNGLVSNKGFSTNDLIERNSFEFSRFSDDTEVAAASETKIRQINEFNDKLSRIVSGSQIIIKSINSVYHTKLSWWERWSGSKVNEANRELKGVCTNNFGKIENFLGELQAYITQMDEEYPSLVDGFTDRSTKDLILEKMKLIKSAYMSMSDSANQCMNERPSLGHVGTSALDMWEEILSYLRNEMVSICETLSGYAKSLSGDLGRLKNVAGNLSSDYEVWKRQAALAAEKKLKQDKAKFFVDKKEVYEHIQSVINTTKLKLDELDNDNLSPQDRAINSVISSEFTAQYDTSIARLKSNLLSLEKLEAFSSENRKKMDSIISAFSKEIDNINDFEVKMEARRDSLLNTLRDIIKQKRDLVNYLNDMKQGLNYEWESALLSLKPVDQEKLKALIESNINDANALIDNEITRCKDMVISVKNDDTKLGLQRIWNKVKNDITKDIEGIKQNVYRKRTIINVSAMRRDIEDELRHRDTLWEAYKKRFSPDETEGAARAAANKVWKRANSKYEKEVSWDNDNLAPLLNSEENDDNEEAKLKNALDIIRERIEVFGHELDACSEPIMAAIDDEIIEKKRKWAWEKIFNTDGAIPLLKKEVGEHSKNENVEDSEHIARVIDSFLPGNYAVAKDMTMNLRSPGHSVTMISGAPGYGKTQTVRFVATASEARVVDVDYSDIISMGGQQYAEQKVIKGAGKEKDDPVTMVFMDDVDDIVRKREGGKAGENTAKVLKLIDTLKKAAESGYKIKIYCVSNLDKSDLDSAFKSRVTISHKLGDKIDYKSVLSVICAGVQVAAEDRSKEDFLNEITRTCDKLRSKGVPLGPRELVEAIRQCQIDWCNKRGGDAWNAKLRASDIIQKLQAIGPSDYF